MIVQVVADPDEMQPDVRVSANFFSCALVAASDGAEIHLSLNQAVALAKKIEELAAKVGRGPS